MTTFNQKNQKVSGNQYNIGGNLIIGVNEVQNELSNLIPQIHAAAEKGLINSETVTNIESEIRNAVDESRKPEPSSKNIIEHLNGAKALIEGLASAGGLVKVFVEAADMVKRFLP